MSELHLSDEILMAFADGELDEPIASAVARAMVEDPGIAKRVVDFQQSRQLTRSAYSEALLPEVPRALQAAISGRIEAYEAKERRAAHEAARRVRSTGRWGGFPVLPVALAASVAVVAAGVGYWAGRHGSQGTDNLMARLEDPATHRELSRVASGADTDLPFGRLRVISSYRLGNGVLCREFRLILAFEAAEAVACRRDGWNVTFALAADAADAGYVPSGGEDPMATYLQAVGAGAPLVDEVEAKALSEGR